MMDRFGRRMTLICINLISIISWLIIGLSSRRDADIFFAQLMVAWTIIGELRLDNVQHNEEQTYLIEFFSA